MTSVSMGGAPSPLRGKRRRRAIRDYEAVPRLKGWSVSPGKRPEAAVPIQEGRVREVPAQLPVEPPHGRSQVGVGVRALGEEVVRPARGFFPPDGREAIPVVPSPQTEVVRHGQVSQKLADPVDDLWAVGGPSPTIVRPSSRSTPRSLSNSRCASSGSVGIPSSTSRLSTSWRAAPSRAW